MTVYSKVAGSGIRHTASAPISLSKSLHEFLSVTARIGGKALSKVHIGMKPLQMSRVISALSNMSDHHLAQIGISRSDIPGYAEKLLADE